MLESKEERRNSEHKLTKYKKKKSQQQKQQQEAVKFPVCGTFICTFIVVDSIVGERKRWAWFAGPAPAWEAPGEQKVSLEVALDSSVARRREAGPDEFADAWIRTVSVGLTCVQRTGSRRLDFIWTRWEAGRVFIILTRRRSLGFNLKRNSPHFFLKKISFSLRVALKTTNRSVWLHFFKFLFFLFFISKYFSLGKWRGCICSGECLTFKRP